MARIYANINTDVLKWARRRAHYSEKLLSKKIGVPPEKYRTWEAGDAKPTLNQLRKIVSILRQPLLAFFGPAVPEESEPLAEMRRLPGTSLEEESPQLALQVHAAMERREIAVRLFEELGERPPSFSVQIKSDQNPEDAAHIVRQKLAVKIDEQVSWRDPYAAMRRWREALENEGILVFHIPSVELAEMRGFSLATHPLPIIGINSNDRAPRARIFTLFHELVHILLEDSVLHTASHSWFRRFPGRTGKTEKFCNAVAAAILVPKSDLLSQVSRPGGKADWREDQLEALVRRYKVSGAALVRRLRGLDLITPSSFNLLREKYDSLRGQTVSSGGDFYANKIAHVGTLLPRLAFRGYYDNKLTTSDLSSIFGMKVKSIGTFEQRILGFNYGFEAS